MITQTSPTTNTERQAAPARGRRHTPPIVLAMVAQGLAAVSTLTLLWLLRAVTVSSWRPSPCSSANCDCCFEPIALLCGRTS